MPELMKGHKWSERKHHMKYPAWAEIKQDEIRCHVIVNWDAELEQNYVQFLSYAGKPLANMAVFADKFQQLSDSTGYSEFDCGFEVNRNFNDSYRWVRSTKGLPKDLEGLDTAFYLYDLPELVGVEFSHRVLHRHNTAVVGLELGLDMYVPSGQWVNDEADVDLAFVQARKMKLEGLMVKSLSHMYERGKRSNGWLKVKSEDDADGIIRKLHEAHSEAGEPLGRIGSIEIEVEDGSVATPHGIAHELGKDMFDNPDKYLGQWAEFKYMERDRQGGYRHPTFHRVREAKV